MLATRRSAAQGLRQAQQLRSPQARRNVASGHGEPRTADAHSHGTGHEVNNESFGTSFYICLAMIPATYFTYTLSRPGKDGQPHPLTKVINKYSDYKEEFSQRNALHTRMVEQAGHDKNLFFNTPSPNHIDLRMPEVFGQGQTMINCPAGHHADMSKLIAHYREKSFKEEAEKLEKMRRGELPDQNTQGR